MKLLRLLVTTAAAIFGEPDPIAPLDLRGLELFRGPATHSDRICVQAASTCSDEIGISFWMAADGSLDNSGTTGGKR